jgi:RNA polymerase sigma-70 factor (ECF subfamily)
MWPDASETEAMLKRAASDDRAAVERLLACHREPLRRMIALRLGPSLNRREDASDIVQGVLFDASTRLADYLRHPALPFAVWLRQIANDRLIDVYRRHRVAARRSIDRERPLAAKEFFDRSSLDLAAELRDQGPTPAAEAIRRELLERFHAALAELGHDDREIVIMRHFEHLSGAEAARALNLTEPAAGMRYLRALRRLRVILGNKPSRGD